MQKLNRTLRILTAAGLICSLLSACGHEPEPQTQTTPVTGAPSPSAGNAVPNAASTSAATPLSTREASLGAVTGFGSVIVEGVKYEDEQAAVKLDIDPTTPVVGRLTDIKLGMRVEVQADGAVASEFKLHAEVMGRVSSLGADSVVVAGQTVKVSADPASATIFEGLTQLSDLVAGDFVEVYGQRDAAGVVIASRIERKQPEQAHLARIAGNIASLDKTAKTFLVGGLKVSYAQALRVVPNVDALADGSKVVVFSTTAISAGTLTAKAIRVAAKASPELVGMLRVGGHIRDLDFAAKTFSLDGLTVDASKAVVEKGTLNDLANGLHVRIKGSYAEGKLSASELKFAKHQGDGQVDVKGEVTDFVSSASFKVRGVPFDASASTIVFVNGDATKLVAGARIRIKGDAQGDMVKPLSIEFLASEAPRSDAAVVSAASKDNVSQERVRKDNLPSATSVSTQSNVVQIDVDNKTVPVNGNSSAAPVGVAGESVLEALKNGTVVPMQAVAQVGQAQVLNVTQKF